MKVLVVGGAGYIGSHMTLMLRASGHEAVVLERRDASVRVERDVLRRIETPELATGVDALVRDANGEQVVWVVQMESAAEANRHGITRDSFPQGTVFSMGVHPRRDGKPAGDRGDSGLFQCPKGKVPAPGKHCDSVEGSKAFGEGVLPPEGPVKR